MKELKNEYKHCEELCLLFMEKTKILIEHKEENRFVDHNKNCSKSAIRDIIRLLRNELNCMDDVLDNMKGYS